MKRPGDPGYAPGWCVHYRYNRGARGADDDTCEAGVRYLTLDSVPFARRPCFLTPEGESKPGAVACQHLRRPTPEEIRAHTEWRAGRVQLLRTVMEGIAPWLAAHAGQSAAEVVVCPACGGRLRLSLAHNGHCHGHCETTGCASWIQ